MTSSSNRAIIYIAGAGRTGSSVLADFVADALGAPNLGELFFVWDRGASDRICRCGRPNADCPTWRDLADRPYSEVVELRDRLARTRHSLKAVRAKDPKGSELVATMTEMYGRLFDRLDTDILVDSSKYPTYACWLTQMPGIDVHVIHVERRAADSCVSWSKPKSDPAAPDGLLPGHGFWAALGQWVRLNAMAVALLRRRAKTYQRVAFESFRTDGQRVLDDLVARTGLTPIEPPSTSRCNVSANPTLLEEVPTAATIRIGPSRVGELSPVKRLAARLAELSVSPRFARGIWLGRNA